MKELLYKGDWVKLVKNFDYEYVDERPCVYIYLVIKTAKGYKFGIRKEWCPSYFKHNEELTYTVISGGIEEGSLEDNIKRELFEEAGIRFTANTKYKLAQKHINVCKSTNLIVDIVLVELDEKDEGTKWFYDVATGDGTVNELKSKTYFMQGNKLEETILTERHDLLLYCMYFYLKHRYPTAFKGV